MWNHGYQGGKASHGDSIPLWWVRREARRGHTKVRKCKTSAWRRKNRKRKRKRRKEGRGKKWAGSVHQAAHVPLACIYITIQRHPSLPHSLTHSPELLFCLRLHSCPTLTLASLSESLSSPDALPPLATSPIPFTCITVLRPQTNRQHRPIPDWAIGKWGWKKSSKQQRNWAGEGRIEWDRSSIEWEMAQSSGRRHAHKATGRCFASIVTPNRFSA